MAAKIPGGYILEARCIGESDISKASPSTRELWTWLLRNVNYKDMQTRTGKVIGRGEMLTTYQDIIDGLSWYRGYRKCKYNKTLIETGMKTLRNAGRITTTKTTRGVIVKVVKFSFYQNPKNYEDYTNAATTTTTETLRTPHDNIRIKESKEGKKKDYSEMAAQVLEYLNLKSGKRFRPGDKNLKAISARFNDGYTFDDWKKVIDTKIIDWKGDERNDKYLTPETLSRHFDNYLNQRAGLKKKSGFAPATEVPVVWDD